MSKVSFGVVGFGNMGASHCRSLNGKVNGAALGAICESSPERLAAAKEQFGDKVKYYDDYDKFLAAGEIDAVLVATPHYDHPSRTIAAFAAGKHVLVEKPAGVHCKAVREMNAAYEKTDNLVFGIMYNQRTIPAHRKLRDLLASGEAGEIQSVVWLISNWFRSQAYYDSGSWRATWEGEGGGVLLNQCPHNLDLLQWFCGMPAKIQGFCHEGKYHDIEVEDDVTAYLEFPNGATGVFITSTGEAPGTNRLEIATTRGKIILENQRITFYRTSEDTLKFCQTTKGMFAQPEVWECKIPLPGNKPGSQHEQIMQNFTNAITKGEELIAPGLEGINGLEMSNAILLSSWEQKSLTLPVDPERFYEKLQEKIKNSTVSKKAGKEKVADLKGSF